MTRTCAIVFPDGRFRYEKGDQRFREKASQHVFEGSIAADRLQELQALLDNPELKSLKHRNFPTGVLASEFEITDVAIVRADGIQNLTFTSYFGTHTNPTQPGGLSNMKYSTDEEVKIVKPIRRWVKEAIESRKGSEIKDAVQTACVPVPR